MVNAALEILNTNNDGDMRIYSVQHDWTME